MDKSKRIEELRTQVEQAKNGSGTGKFEYVEIVSSRSY